MTSLFKDRRGTTSVGIAAIATMSVGIGAAYLGYHKHTTGNAIKKLVPEWRVAQVQGDSPPLLAMNPLDAFNPLRKCVERTQVPKVFAEPQRSEGGVARYDGHGHPINEQFTRRTGGEIKQSKEFHFPAASTHRAVSRTGKTMCFYLNGTYHCHVSGTNTGYLSDWPNNYPSLPGQLLRDWTCPDTDDGKFLEEYMTRVRSWWPQAPFNVSGHSQGAADAAGIARRMRAGDQLILVQPATAGFSESCGLSQAYNRGVNVFVSRSQGDIVSSGIQLRGSQCYPVDVMSDENICDDIVKDGKVVGRDCGGPGPLTHGPGRVHNAPNARHQFKRDKGIGPGLTPNPALDASINSNPGSPSSHRWESPPMQRDGGMKMGDLKRQCFKKPRFNLFPHAYCYDAPTDHTAPPPQPRRNSPIRL